MGLLSSIYQYGHVAYVGGGFGDGIHNTIEAAVYGLPVIFGPKYEHFREAKALIANEGGCSISNYEQLEKAIDEMLRSRQKTGLNAARYVESELGATDRIYKALFKSKVESQKPKMTKS
jgi:3-deoxy-D-manno-octulosonic-acid transferase